MKIYIGDTWVWRHFFKERQVSTIDRFTVLLHLHGGAIFLLIGRKFGKNLEPTIIIAKISRRFQQLSS